MVGGMEHLSNPNPAQRPDAPGHLAYWLVAAALCGFIANGR